VEINDTTGKVNFTLFYSRCVGAWRFSCMDFYFLAIDLFVFSSCWKERLKFNRR
jgi:hypothetical protein